MFFSVKELEHRIVRFDVSFPPGEIDFLDPALRQVLALETEGMAELLGSLSTESQRTGRFRGRERRRTTRARADRCFDACAGADVLRLSDGLAVNRDAARGIRFVQIAFTRLAF